MPLVFFVESLLNESLGGQPTSHERSLCGTNEEKYFILKIKSKVNYALVALHFLVSFYREPFSN